MDAISVAPAPSASSPLPLSSGLLAWPEGAVHLADWGVIRAEGADAATFLHSQLTHDITGLQPSQARLTGYCSAKGRLLASFMVCKAADDSLLLACSADVLPAALKRLSMFVLRAKCRLSDASSTVHCWGLSAVSTLTALGVDGLTAPGSVAVHDGAQFIRLHDGQTDAQAVPRWLALVPADSAASRAIAALPALDEQTWRGLEVASGVPRITAATVEQFVPQMINFDLVDGVSFSKGCYPGQEVVARSQYRGSVKRRLFRFTCDQTMQPGAEVFHDADPAQPAGMVVNVGAVAGDATALVEVKLSALENGTLHLGNPQGALLRRVALPYDVPQPG